MTGGRHKNTLFKKWSMAHKHLHNTKCKSDHLRWECFFKVTVAYYCALYRIFIVPNCRLHAFHCQLGVIFLPHIRLQLAQFFLSASISWMKLSKKQFIWQLLSWKTLLFHISLEALKLTLLQKTCQVVTPGNVLNLVCAVETVGAFLWVLHAC